MRKLLLVCFFLGYSLCGSTQGIEFKETNFDKILEIAKKEGKMIFWMFTLFGADRVR